MDENKVHLRHILLYYFRKGANGAQARRNICDVYGAEAVTKSICLFWFKRFRSGNFHIEDAARSGRPSVAVDNEILMLVRNNQHLTTREIAEKFNINYSTAARRLKRLGMVKNNDAWVSEKPNK